MSGNVFNAYSRYYDLFYRDKNYDAEVQYIDGLLRRYGVKSGEVLEFGSGTGKHGRILAQRGFRVTGVELSSEMVAIAERAPGFNCLQGDVRTVQLNRKFDVVLSLFHVISYQTTNADVNAVFARAAEHLPVGGLFVFDAWYTPAVYAQRPEVRIKRLRDGDVEFTRLAEPVLYPNENRVDVNYTVIAHDTATGACQVLKETHPMRHFSAPELALFASKTGFETICVESFLDGGAPGESTWGVCFVLKKVEL